MRSRRRNSRTDRNQDGSQRRGSQHSHTRRKSGHQNKSGDNYYDQFYIKDRYGRTQYSRDVENGDNYHYSGNRNNEYWSAGGYRDEQHEKNSGHIREQKRKRHYNIRDERYSRENDYDNNTEFREDEYFRNHNSQMEYEQERSRSGNRGGNGFERTGRRVRETWKDHKNKDRNQLDESAYSGEYTSYKQYTRNGENANNHRRKNSPTYGASKRRRKRVYEW